MTPQRRSPEPPALSLGLRAGAGRIVLELRGPIRRADIPFLFERARTLLEAADEEVVICDVGGIVEPDIAAVDVLARLQLCARQRGGRVHVRDVGTELRALMALVGLLEILTPLDLIVETGREVEEGEQPGGVEEEDDPTDPIV